MRRQLDMFAAVERGTAFQCKGRLLVIARVCGDDDAAPVIVEERDHQLGMWSKDAVSRAIAEDDTSCL